MLNTLNDIPKTEKGNQYRNKDNKF